MTIEEVTAERDALQNLLDEAETAREEADKTLADLTAERDSLSEELEGLKAQLAKQGEELAETKKLNYTLGRTIGSGKTLTETADESIKSLFAEIR